MGSYNLDVQTAKNRMTLTLEGQLDTSEVDAVVDAMADGAQDLDDGWELINDISGFKPAAAAAEASLKDGARQAGRLGMDTVVRVTGESVTAEFQWERIGDEASSEEGYDVFVAESVDDAAAMLDDHQ
ncbi:hypothetical protein Hrd1104_01175 [Halorhabdus sp. CBA1104]|uniref:hypothetical protein n=1 Tax=unclassified Halorhabdus TaxID=2621901 RepID=UPI0012B2F641|nr:MULTISPECIES: hypothetical protein [unclassified Halorhabdus]QGN06037.1 hypothetical protein Hrd1104_01175 [Halorhabdus sp. CBA1104]